MLACGGPKSASKTPKKPKDPVLPVFDVNNDKVEFIEGYPLEKILALSVKVNKPIFIDVYTPTCEPCKWLDQDVFTNNQPMAYYYNKHYINFKIDGFTEEGKKVLSEYMIGNYPTLLFINGQGIEARRHVGMIAGSKLIELGAEVKEAAGY